MVTFTVMPNQIQLIKQKLPPSQSAVVATNEVQTLDLSRLNEYLHFIGLYHFSFLFKVSVIYIYFVLIY